MTIGVHKLEYEVLEGWERLPEGWSFVEVAGVAVDSRDRVYVFNRGAHPVIVFDKVEAHRVYSAPNSRHHLRRRLGRGSLQGPRARQDASPAAHHLASSSQVEPWIKRSSDQAVLRHVAPQIWIAVSVYVLVAIKKRLDLDASLYTLLQILSVTLFEKMPIHQALAGDENRCNASQITNQLNLFDF